MHWRLARSLIRPSPIMKKNHPGLIVQTGNLRVKIRLDHLAPLVCEAPHKHDRGRAFP